MMLAMGRRLKAIECFLRRWVSSRPDPELTALRYNVKRGSYAVPNDTHVAFFEKLLGPGGVITDSQECDAYNVDWLKIVKGSSRLVLRPRSTEEVSAVLRYCDERRLALCPQSGNTSLVGGSVPVFDEIVLSMRLMDRIIHTDELAGVVVCEAGCVLQRLDEHLSGRDLMMPIDLGAKGSCLIGGNVSTNAGGLRLLRYGNLHGNVLGLEAVMANGNVIDCLNTLKKDNTGYHLKHLFIGSEGTLGVVTKLAIQCPNLPKAINVAFLGLRDFKKVLETYRLAKGELSEILSSCEMMDRVSMDIAEQALGLKNPLASENDFYMLIETSGSQLSHDEEKVKAFLEKVMELGIVDDGTVTSDPSKIQKIWEVRERLAEAMSKEHYLFKYDISLPLSEFYSIVAVLKDHLKDCDVRYITGFGHLGDGNLHVQVLTSDYDAKVNARLEPFIFEYTSKMRGSISAEHGIGFKKAKFLRYSKDESAIELMRNMKRAMDPNGILNPYKVFT
ncbi:PREDICTED: D-2-hydroxyglutarate dehydrogenase, mitochondrial [Ceratosolen solmsi marchali]|uniref:D-2-hydroxyglutarate dehydrogenase, mitochondrial n=1 Tax=Ceratosolen solmsi marchali TaxID=326594 RepID=A0AAJ6YK80_9HYME|nr:PREDICTED: D-2-hydroxyglutarate dehydrogenase, mitochondrial [Ceratosolen solmsi marchali]